MTSRASHRFGALDALRGVAAIAVVFYHFRYFFSPAYSFPGGYLAVDFFFVLSGFVIGHAYDAKIGGGMTTAEFIERRLIRFLPLVWLGVAIGAACLAFRLLHGATDFTKRDIVLAVLHNALLLPSNFGKGNLLFPTNWPVWSLFMELLVNLAYVVFYRRLTNRVLAILVAAALPGLAAIALIHGDMNAGVLFEQLPAAVVRVIFSFFAGLLIYRMRPLWEAQLPRVSVWVLLPLLAGFFWLPIGPALRPYYDIAAVAVLSPLLVMLGSVSPPIGRGGGLAVWLGVISYPVYAVHGPVGDWDVVLQRSHPALGPWWSLLMVAAVIAVAAPLEKVYHRRFGGWLSRLAGTRLSDF